MKIKELGLDGSYLIEPKVFHDKTRSGFFFEAFKQNVLIEHGISVNWIQDNHSQSGKHVMRGLHFQKPPFAQDKLCRVIRGRVLVIIVDLRKGSDTFGKAHTEELSEENFKQIFVPKGFAHGFLTLSEKVDYLYKVSAPYAPDYEGGILWNDPELSIKYPDIDITVLERDQNWPRLSDFTSPFI